MTPITVNLFRIGIRDFFGTELPKS